MPLPQVGQTVRQFGGWPAAVQAASTVCVGEGEIVPEPVNWLVRWTSVTVPSVPAEVLLDALMGPLTVMSSCDVTVIEPRPPPARACTEPVDVTVTPQPSISTLPPSPQSPVESQPPPPASTRPLTVTEPTASSPASTTMLP